MYDCHADAHDKDKARFGGLRGQVRETQVANTSVDGYWSVDEELLGAELFGGYNAHVDTQYVVELFAVVGTRVL